MLLCILFLLALLGCRASHRVEYVPIEIPVHHEVKETLLRDSLILSVDSVIVEKHDTVLKEVVRYYGIAAEAKRDSVAVLQIHDTIYQEVVKQKEETKARDNPLTVITLIVIGSMILFFVLKYKYWF